MPTVNAFYKVVLNGVCGGQKVVNVLYYRLAPDIIPGTFTLAGAGDLAFQVKQEIWDGGMKGQSIPAYTLQDITVYPMDNLFAPIYQMPYVLNVAQAGARAGLAGQYFNGPAVCCIVRFRLEPTSILNGISAPRSGYVALGPLADIDVDNSGNLVQAAAEGYGSVGVKMAQDLENLVPTVIFYPIRVKTARLLGATVITGWADVEGVTIRSLASFRRSRQPEA